MSSRKVRRSLVRASAFVACAALGITLVAALLAPDGHPVDGDGRPRSESARAAPSLSPGAPSSPAAVATASSIAPPASRAVATGTERAPLASTASDAPRPGPAPAAPGPAPGPRLQHPGGAHLYGGDAFLRVVPSALFLDAQRRDVKSAQLERSADVAQKRGTIVGAISTVDEKTISGWAYAWDATEQPLLVEVFVDGVLRATATTRTPREGFATESSNPVRARGWSATSPGALDDGDAHWVEALASIPGSTRKTKLQGSPWRFGGSVWPEGQLRFVGERFVFGWARDPAKPDLAVPVDLLVDGRALATVETVAPARNAELLARARSLHPKPDEVPGVPDHGRAFLHESTAALQGMWLQARVRGSLGRELHGSPRRIGEEKNRLPYGGVTFVNETQVSGWVVDPDTLPKPAEVDVWIDGAFHQRVVADKTFAVLPQVTGLGEAEHAFVVAPPDRYRDGKVHTIQFFGVNQPEGANPELAGSPAHFVGKRNAAPLGWLDSVTQDEVSGWAYDPDAQSRPIDVEIWVDGALFKRATASVTRPDLVPIVCPEPDHGYRVPLGDKLKDGKQHVVRVLAVNHPDGPSQELAGSPKELNAQQPWFGISLDDAADAQGLKITNVAAESPAARGGMIAGDVIRAYDGREQKLDAVAFVAWAKTKEVGEQVVFKLWHDPLAQPQPGPGADPGSTALAANERVVVVTVGSR